ncbi:DinB superfamily protein [Collimonas sp. OK242]|uniref:DinB family protein n=1 Tax=Collimonas sp. OK242 TaxID=1798195 RepID=UPI0008988201|nr:DinB family protein [Collimonas sp. OK242]SDY30758.1 DinB superfamily protein [Collimonas sp. OK242]
MHPITIDALAAFPLQLEAHFAAIPSEFRHWTPASWEGVPSEPFTAIEQICHVRDIEIDGYQLRFRRTLAEVNPLLVSIDSDALAGERAYAAADPGAVFAAFRAARAETVELLSSLHQEQFKRCAEFEGYGPVTLRGLVHYLCSHDQQHLAGLQWLLGKIEAARL